MLHGRTEDPLSCLEKDSRLMALSIPSSLPPYKPTECLMAMRWFSLLISFAFPFRKNPLEVLSSLPLVCCRTAPEEHFTNLRNASLLLLRNSLELCSQLWTDSHPEKSALRHPQTIVEKRRKSVKQPLTT